MTMHLSVVVSVERQLETYHSARGDTRTKLMPRLWEWSVVGYCIHEKWRSTLPRNTHTHTHTQTEAILTVVSTALTAGAGIWWPACSAVVSTLPFSPSVMMTASQPLLRRTLAAFWALARSHTSIPVNSSAWGPFGSTNFIGNNTDTVSITADCNKAINVKFMDYIFLSPALLKVNCVKPTQPHIHAVNMNVIIVCLLSNRPG